MAPNWVALIIFFCAAASSVIVVLRCCKTHISLKTTLAVVALKGMVGLVHDAVFMYYYQSGDSLSYFSDSYYIASAWEKSISAGVFACMQEIDPNIQLLTKTGFFESRFFLKFLGTIRWVAQHNFFITGLFLSLIHSISLLYFLYELKRYNNSFFWPAISAFVVFPDILFWASGVAKESVVIAFLWVSCACLLAFYRSINLWYLGVAFSFLVLVFQIKFYLSLVPITFFICMISKMTTKDMYTKRIVFMALVGFFCLVICLYIYWVLPVSGMEFLHINHTLYKNLDFDKSLFFYAIDGKLYNLAINMGLAFIYHFLAPFPWQAYSLFSQVYSLFTLLYSVFILGACFVAHKKKISIFSADILLQALLVAVCVYAVLLPLSAPNIAALVRYRIVSYTLAIFIAFYFLRSVRV